MGVKTIVSPNSICTTAPESTTIFLAGSIKPGVAREWQKDVIKEFNQIENSSITIFNPKREDWNEDWNSMKSPEFYQQTNWEMNGLDKCDIIFMYFDPNCVSIISVLELGLHASSEKIIVCCPEEYWRRGNVEAVCEKYGIPFFEDFETAKASLLNMFNGNTSLLFG